MPNGVGPFPGVVFIGGSGPTDMDSTNGVNKMLKDLAWGLSSQGVAVLRFNKRTYQYGSGAFPNGSAEEFTIASEYTEDALAALALLRKHPKISKVILAGHSLGAEVASHIVQQANPAVNGVILLAATSTNLPDLLPWQYYYLTNYNTTYAEKAVQCRDLIESPTLTATTIVNCGAIDSSLAAFNMYGNYYLSEREYDPPPAIAAQLTVPMLVLQGTADYNVPYAIPSTIPLYGITVPTFAAWQSAFASSKRVTLQVFSGLSHYFMFATNHGFATPTQEAAKSNVQADVVSAISHWVTTVVV